MPPSGTKLPRFLQKKDKTDDFLDQPRPRSRPLSTASDIPSPLYSSTSRMSDLPTRLSGWFSHTFSSSSTDLTLPNIISQSHSMSVSPRSKGSALLNAAKHSKDRAMRYLLDSDATPDRSPDPIWLLGVLHQGYEPPPQLSSSLTSSSKNPASHWPPVFYADFTSRLWLTYRSHFAPIRDIRLCDLDDSPTPSITQTPTRRWNWASPEKGWTSDAGWGCMLRTGQSLLANALLHIHLGRQWRRPQYHTLTQDYATYVRILTWFFDDTSPEAPFSVHRMALAGKDLGKDVGQWFGPSTAAGAIKTLVQAFPDAGLGVSVASDGIVFQSDVYAASHSTVPTSPHRSHTKLDREPSSSVNRWGDRPVLILLGIRLGIDCVNPIYYDTIKTLYTIPQSVGIAGGRPSSSYYFVGTQGDTLFYLDPHHARPTVPLRSIRPDDGLTDVIHIRDESLDASPSRSDSAERKKKEKPKLKTRSKRAQTIPSPSTPSRTPSLSNSYSDSNSNSSSPAPSPTTSAISTPSHTSGSSISSHGHTPYSPSPLHREYADHPRQHDHGLDQSRSGTDEMLESELTARPPPLSATLDPVSYHYATAYSYAELGTFHCDRVRKMHLSGLDPSMLLGFLVRDEEEWEDLRKRVGELTRTIFSIQDEPPTWPSDSDDNMGLESISDPDEVVESGSEDESEGVGSGDERPGRRDNVGEGEEGEDSDQDEFFEAQSGTPSTSSVSLGQGKRVQDGDGEEEGEWVESQFDGVDGEGRTPGPGSGFVIAVPGAYEEGGDIEDDWVDPVSCPVPDVNANAAGVLGGDAPSTSTSTKTRSAGKLKSRTKSKNRSKEKASPSRSASPSVARAAVDERGTAGPSSPPSSSPTPPLPQPPSQPKSSLPLPRAAGMVRARTVPAIAISVTPPPEKSKERERRREREREKSRDRERDKDKDKERRRDKDRERERRSTLKDKKRQSAIPVPVPVPQPSVSLSSFVSDDAEPSRGAGATGGHLPFPSWSGDEELVAGGGMNGVGTGTREKRMHTGRARDGGRTQSGGVKGVLE